jgi:hypothetical protein
MGSGKLFIGGKLGSLGVCTLREDPRAVPAAQLEAATTGYLPGSFRSLVEFHPLIILYITTKITQKTTIFNGIIKPSQSICTFSFYLPFQALLIYLGFDPSSTENKWLISANRPWTEVPGAPGATTHQIQKTPELWES